MLTKLNFQSSLAIFRQQASAAAGQASSEAGGGAAAAAGAAQGQGSAGPSSCTGGGGGQPQQFRGVAKVRDGWLLLPAATLASGPNCLPNRRQCTLTRPGAAAAHPQPRCAHRWWMGASRRR